MEHGVKEIASRIDHTLLKPESTSEDMRRLCAEADQYQFAAVCILPPHVALCNQLLNHSSVNICTVVGFPLGSNDTRVKSLETQLAVIDGADEIDMVINISALKEMRLTDVTQDIRAVVQAADGRTVKVILETCLLTNAEIKSACQCAMEAGADFVKTSTGFNKTGASIEHVRLMKATVGEQLKVKASGGIRDRETALAMLEAGADRLGTSSGVAIIEGQQSEGSY